MCKYKQGMQLCLLILASIGAGAQPVQVGERLQARLLKNIVHYDKPQVHLDAYKKKNIILEFWSKTCAVCIKNFPKLVQLQKQYKDKLQIIAINQDSKEETEKLLEKQKVPKGIIPFVTADKVMCKIFPRNYNPWVVWIDNNGIVRYISDGEWLNDENVLLFVKGEKPKLIENNFIEKPKTAVPLFAADNGKWAGKMVFYSYLSNCIKGLSIHNFTLTDSTQNFWITRNCKSAEELFQDAFGEGVYNRFGHPNKVVLHLRDPYSFIRPKIKDSAWAKQYSYNYEISLRSSRGKSIYKMMQEDLQRLFNVTAGIRNEKIQCLLLVRTDSVDRITTKGGVHVNNLPDQNGNEKVVIKNTPFGEFVYKLQSMFNPRNSNAPLIDATGFNGNIDIELDKKVFEKPNLGALKKALNPFGLDIVIRDFETEVLVISQN